MPAERAGRAGGSRRAPPRAPRGRSRRPRRRKLSLVVFSGGFEAVHYALVMASAAAAVETGVTLLFTMGAIRALLKPTAMGAPGWHGLEATAAGLSAAARDAEFAALGVATFEELLAAAAALGVGFLVCEMGLRAMRLSPADLRSDLGLKVSGVVGFLADAGDEGRVLFV
ncbi:MAG: DsrE/DsrF/DrsH-like family protein [Proteobacteria bacterium]|nr:DsrE/DsrF/DrsH-like family protein [Pseudomonadota bacterium]